MKKKEQLKQIIWDFHLQNDFNTLPRDIEIPTNSGKIISLVGARRSGKTFILYDTINKIVRDTSKTQTLFINFEDERLDLNVEELDLILQAYSELYPDQHLDTCYFFFDEIQNIDGWERFIRRVYDTITRNIFITGSNSKLLSSEIATSLRGRTLGFEIYPLSFREYLSFKRIKADFYSSRQLAFIRNAQTTFLSQGGFPETLFLEERLHPKLLQEYFNVLLYRDIVERYHVSNLPALKYFMKKLLASSTKQVSVHKIYNDLKSANIKIGKNTLYDFLEYAQNSYLGLILPRYDQSLVSRELGEKKVYAIDTGLCNAVEYKFSENLGKALENAAFLELKKRGHDIFYYRDDSCECDFLIADRGKIIEAIQVCYDLSNPETKKRELKGLNKACTRFGLDKGTMITNDTTDEIESDNTHIEILPFYQKFA
jgi:predicted AAA+ superfamily ATPase